MVKLTAEKRSLQEKLRESEAQLNQLKTRKREDLKVRLPACPPCLACLTLHSSAGGPPP